MNRKTVGWIAALAFVMGCVTAKQWIPPAWAGTEAPVRWDYSCFKDNGTMTGMDLDAVQEKLKAAGQQGWELATQAQVGNIITVCMKRRIP